MTKINEPQCGVAKLPIFTAVYFVWVWMFIILYFYNINYIILSSHIFNFMSLNTKKSCWKVNVIFKFLQKLKLKIKNLGKLILNRLGDKFNLFLKCLKCLIRSIGTKIRIKICLNSKCIRQRLKIFASNPLN